MGAVPLSGRHIQHIAELMPSFRSLVCESGLNLSVAFQLVRPLLRAALIAGEDSTMSTVPEFLRPWHPFSDDIRSVVIQYYSPKCTHCTDGRGEHGTSGTCSDEPESVTVMETAAAQTEDIKQQKAVVKDVDIWSCVSYNLVITFWSLSLSDLSCPVDR